MAKGTRPALDVVIPVAAKTLADVVEAIADDFCPFAIEAPGDQSAPSTSGSDLLRRIYFSRDSNCHAAARAITDTLGHAGVTAHPVDVLDDGADWAARSQEGLRAVRVGNIVVAPPWDAMSQTPDTSVIVIRPSIGFGTGHHASTRLCLHALQAQPVHGVAVTDLGTGSGVLAIAAVRLGARSVVAVEHDPDVTASARENFAANDVADTVRLLQADITTTTPSPPAEIVVANLNRCGSPPARPVRGRLRGHRRHADSRGTDERRGSGGARRVRGAGSAGRVDSRRGMELSDSEDSGSGE